MITVAKATSASYYTDGDGGSGAESYYLDAVTEGEPPGRWAGSGAALLGLSGPVGAEDMETLFEEFTDPITGERLGNRPAQRVRTAQRLAAALAAEPDATPERQDRIRADVLASARTGVIGWDLTFAMPKSVTVLHTAATRGMISAARAGEPQVEAAYRWVRDQVDAAIARANEAALEAVESTTTARAGGGTGAAMRWEQARAMVVASFYQHTSRSIEPHLHVHNVALNKVLCADGQWRAIDGQDLLAQRFAFSGVADRALVEGLAGLGYAWRDRPDGAGKELALVPEAAMAHFSSRDLQVNAAMAPLVEAAQERLGRDLTGGELAAVHRQAQRSSRAEKDHADRTADELNDTWAATLAADVGHSLDTTGAAALGSVLDRMPAALRDGLPGHVVAGARRAVEQATASPSGARPDAGPGGSPTGPGVAGAGVGTPAVWSPRRVIEQAVAGCATRSATWGRSNLLLEIERALPVLGIDPGDGRDVLDRLTDRALAWAGVVQVTHPGPEPRDDTEGGALPAPRSATLYAAADTLAAEAALRAAAIDRGRHALDRAEVATWLDVHAPTIGADQRAAVEGIASSDAALAVLVGPAGTGKSFAAGALASAWADLTGGQGRVLGLAVSQIATDVLRDDGIDLSRNIARWLAGQGRLDAGTGDATDRAYALRQADVVLVDESSMVATADLEAVRARVDAAGARLILTGDPRQLGPVEAGGVLGLLDGHAETYTLTDVRRFTHDWERAASLAVRDGAPDALAEYDRHARLVEHATVEDAAEAAALAAVADRVAGRSVVVVAPTNAHAARIAARVRDQLVDLGLVAPDAGTVLGRDGNTASAGDVVTCRRNDYALGVTNRVQYRVLAAPSDLPPGTRRSGGVPDDGVAPGGVPGDGVAPGGVPQGGASQGDVPDGCLLVEPVPVPGREQAAVPVLLPADYVAADVQLGYACTVHSAQGQTVDTAHLVAGGGTGVDAATLYVGMTRGRERNTVHVALATPARPSAPAVATGGGGQIRLEDDSVALSARSVLETALRDAGPGGTGLRHLPGRGTAATVTAEQDAAVRGSMATLTALLEAETRTVCRARLERHLDDALHDGLIDAPTRAWIGDDQGAEHLSRLLRVMEQGGHDPRTVLVDALTHGASLADATSPARVLAHRITRGRPDDALTGPAPVAATIPAGIPDPDAARLFRLQDRAAARTRDLGILAAEHSPEWAVRALGPVPTTDGSPRAAADRADWEHRAGLVAAHREAVGYTDPDRALPRMPGLTSTERRAGYTAAWAALGRPDDTLTEAAMTDGRLLTRITAWEREKAWQPAFVDDRLRAAEADLDAARRAASLADAHAARAEADHEPDRAAAWRAEAADQRTVVDLTTAAVADLTRQAEAYTAWAAHTAVTRDHAERARAEAERRGVDPDAVPADATPADDWLSHQAAAQAAEDTCRPVTDADLAEVDVTGTDRGDDPARIDEHARDDLAAHARRDDPAMGDDAAGDRAADGRAGPRQSAVEVEQLAASTAAVLTLLADRADEEAAHTAAAGEELAIEADDAGRRRRELADLDTSITAGRPRPYAAASASVAASVDPADADDGWD